jgi:hypothetical protein
MASLRTHHKRKRRATRVKSIDELVNEVLPVVLERLRENLKGAFRAEVLSRLPRN